MRVISTLLLTALIGVVLPTTGQNLRFGFVDRPKPGVAIRGVYVLRVSDDPFVRPKTVHPAITLDGRTLADCDSPPWRMEWDTTAVENGEHTLRLVLRDSRSKTEVAVDDIRVIVDNRIHAPANPNKPPVVRPADSPDRFEPKPPSTRASSDAAPVGIAVRTTEQSGARPEPKPLAVKATCLYLAGNALFAGLPDGGILRYETDRHGGAIIPAPKQCGRVRLITHGSGAVWWLAPTIPMTPMEPDANVLSSGPDAGWLFGYLEAEKQSVAVDLRGTVGFEPKQIAYWRGKVLLLGGAGGCAVDPKSGEITSLDSILPPDALSAPREAGVALAVSGEQAVLAVAGRTQVQERGSAQPGLADQSERTSDLTVTFWKSAPTGWKTAGSCAIPDGEFRVDQFVLAGADRATFGSRAGITEVWLTGDSPEVNQVTIAVPGAPGKTAASKSGLWQIRGGAIARADSAGKLTEAYLPWNDPAARPIDIAANLHGAWVATNQGIRRIQPSAAPDSRLGYGGFVRTSLGGENDGPHSQTEARLADEIITWRGTPYVWGGESRSGVDCSGFVMLAYRAIGIGLPHGSDNLRSCKKGVVVHDELRYGDVLVYPGHCAIYVGNGETAETIRGKGPDTGSIWGRREVVVRRFLDETPNRGTLASRGGKPARSQRSLTGKKTSTKKTGRGGAD